MKKIVLPLLMMATTLTACQQSKEQLGLKEVLVEKLSKDSDLKDYKIDPADMADCVIKKLSDDAPGIPGDPRRDRYYAAFTKFVAVNSPAEADQSVKEYQDLFGGIHEAREAATSVTNMIMTCMGEAIDAQPPR